MNALKRTPLHDVHVALGARMVPFAGFEMPVSYSGIIDEHNAVRNDAGLFDVSHMGEFFVSGPDTWKWLDRMVTNDCSKLADGGVLYTVMCRDDGMVVDDLLVTRLAPDRAMIVANASNVEKDFAHLQALVSENVKLEDHSDRWSLLAVQGPRARDILLDCTMFSGARAELEGTDYYHSFSMSYGGDTLMVSRTGYTGELGFEVFVPTRQAVAAWSQIMEAGSSHGLLPVGLAARDTLRFEAAFCLYGHELDDKTTPLEAGVGWVVRLRKDAFVGRDALLREKENGSRKSLVGLELDGRNIARQGFTVRRGDRAAGVVTSGTFSPTLQKSLCLAFVATADREADDLGVEIRGRVVPVRRVAIPFYPSRAKV